MEVCLWILAVGAKFSEYQEMLIFDPPSYILGFYSVYSSVLFLVRWWHDVFEILTSAFKY